MMKSHKKQFNPPKLITGFVLMCFLGTTVAPLSLAQEIMLPAPGMMVPLSSAYNPPILRGLQVHPENPFRFDFILNQGDSGLEGNQLKEESTRLVKYFLAALTVPEGDLWVNLSPYEKDRIISDSFGITEMGRDLLAQDYLLKQITASALYPEEPLGKEFWDRVYQEAHTQFGTTEIPMDTFNKVWIVPEKAVVYENNQTAYVTETKLKVMLEEDYLALEQESKKSAISPKTKSTEVNKIGSQIVREMIIPELEKEVNEGKNFAQLRQVYHSLVLANWYKKRLKDSLLATTYVNKNKVAGVDIADPNEKEKIYQRYLEAFKKGVYSYIKDSYDPVLQMEVPRKYFSGGMKWTEAQARSEYRPDPNPFARASSKEQAVIVDLQPYTHADQEERIDQKLAPNFLGALEDLRSSFIKQFPGESPGWTKDKWAVRMAADMDKLWVKNGASFRFLPWTAVDYSWFDPRDFDIVELLQSPPNPRTRIKAMDLLADSFVEETKNAGQEIPTGRVGQEYPKELYEVISAFAQDPDESVQDHATNFLKRPQYGAREAALAAIREFEISRFDNTIRPKAMGIPREFWDDQRPALVQEMKDVSGSSAVVILTDVRPINRDGLEGNIYPHPNKPDHLIKVFNRSQFIKKYQRSRHVEAYKELYRALKEDSFLKDKLIDMEFIEVVVNGEQTWGIEMKKISFPFPSFLSVENGDKEKIVEAVNQITMTLFGTPLADNQNANFAFSKGQEILLDPVSYELLIKQMTNRKFKAIQEFVQSYNPSLASLLEFADPGIAFNDEDTGGHIMLDNKAVEEGESFSAAEAFLHWVSDTPHERLQISVSHYFLSLRQRIGLLGEKPVMISIKYIPFDRIPKFVNVELDEADMELIRQKGTGRQILIEIIASKIKKIEEQAILSPKKGEASTRNSGASSTVSDRAGLSSAPGGIDLNRAAERTEIQNRSADIDFNIDPLIIEQFQNAPGVVPVIIHILPAAQFLSLEHDTPLMLSSQ